VGAMVPCKSMELSLIDRIFTRLGAKDQLMEGKSTFYIELEETLVPLKYATKDSLFITDELGRGTSTFDGVAIAYSVMKYLVERIKCRVLFATHFRILVEEANLLKDI
jgi:DNA mismatch repair protein MSH6